MATIQDADLAADARALSGSLMEFIRVIQFRDRDRACYYDVSVSQCYALDGVVGAGGLTVNELAAHLYLDKSTASRIAQGLVEKGLIARGRHPEDRRIVRLVPTDEGRSLARRIADDLEAEYRELLSGFDPEVRRAMVQLLTRVGQMFASGVETGSGRCCSLT